MADLPTLSLPLILGAGLIDGINPCAFAVLIFMMGYLTRVSKGRVKLFFMGLTYIFTVYITYLLVGLGLLGVVQAPIISSTIYLIAAFIAIITGLLNIKDYFYYGEGLSLRIPKSQSERINAWVSKASIPAAIAVGFMVSLFELPCTGSVYLVILALLSQSETYFTALTYLFLYNLMFVLPLIVMFVAIMSGYSVKRAKEWKEEHKNVMKLISGLLLISLGVWMLWGIYT
jgi:cytochrome c biogenesis protein CcdA